MTKPEPCRYCGTARTDPPEKHWQYCPSCPRIPDGPDNDDPFTMYPRTYDNEGHVINYPALVMALRRGTCWCGVGIGNPMLGGKHNKLCLYIQSFMPPIGDEDQE